MDYTSRSQLRKPSDGESQDVADLNFNFDRLDAFAAGAHICTSTTRPTSVDRWDGMLIKETDTKAFGFWDASSAQWLMFDTVWQTFSSAFFPVLVLGNGRQVSKYFRTGKKMAVRHFFYRGSTTTMLSATVSVGLPAGLSMPADAGNIGGSDLTLLSGSFIATNTATGYTYGGWPVRAFSNAGSVYFMCNAFTPGSSGAVYNSLIHQDFIGGTPAGVAVGSTFQTWLEVEVA